MNTSRNVVKSWEDWGEKVKKEVRVMRPEGEDLFFEVYAVSEATRLEISENYEKRVGPKPNPPISRKTMIPNDNDPRYKKDLESWKNDQAKALDFMMMEYIEAGWTKPNGFEIPGETPEDKMAALQAKVAGDLSSIYQAILTLSNLKQGDIDLF